MLAYYILFVYRVPHVWLRQLFLFHTSWARKPRWPQAQCVCWKRRHWQFLDPCVAQISRSFRYERFVAQSVVKLKNSFFLDNSSFSWCWQGNAETRLKSLVFQTTLKVLIISDGKRTVCLLRLLISARTGIIIARYHHRAFVRSSLQLPIKEIRTKQNTWKRNASTYHSVVATDMRGWCCSGACRWICRRGASLARVNVAGGNQRLSWQRHRYVTWPLSGHWIRWPQRQWT